MYDIREWRHAFKLDPSKEISDEQLEKVCESGTDAVIIGGTDDVTLDNVLHLLSRVRRYAVPCVLEISNLEMITPGFDLYFIPTVLNSPVAKWVVGLHREAVKEYGQFLNWDEIVMLGYCILNEDSKAAKITRADASLSREDVRAYAELAENMFHLPVFYLEYSGKYGGPEMAAAAKDVLNKTRLFYGGGIRTLKQAEEMAAVADTIIVGNAIYEDFEEALRTVDIKSSR